MNTLQKSHNVAPSEEYELLLHQIHETIEAGASKVREEGIRVKYEIGRIISNSSIYQKGAWGSGKVIGRIANDLMTNTRDVYDCIQFYYRCADYDRKQLVEHVDHRNWINSLGSRAKDQTWSWVRKRLPETPTAPKKKPRRRANSFQVRDFLNRRVGEVLTLRDVRKIEFYLGYVDDPDRIDPIVEFETDEDEEEPWT